jgi:hypothetical protein
VHEVFLKKKGRRPTQAEWEEINDRENDADQYCLALLQEKYKIPGVVDGTLHFDADLNLSGTCYAPKEVVFDLMHMAKGDDCHQDEYDGLHDTAMSIEGPICEKVWNTIHECDFVEMLFWDFPEELIDEFKRDHERPRPR